ncbi:MAG: hypothetical protein HOP29_10475 [Phycisphaerales bacterium]|nr:hypothetical protein [Phycisphaerales bacterium]
MECTGRVAAEWTGDDLSDRPVGLHFVGVRRERNGEKTVGNDGDGTTLGARGDNGRFVNGCAAGPGRPVGAPNKAAFIRDAILDSWTAVDGAALLQRLARDDPRAYLRVVTSVLPKDIDARIAAEAAARATDTRSEVMATPEGQAWMQRLRAACPQWPPMRASAARHGFWIGGLDGKTIGWAGNGDRRSENGRRGDDGHAGDPAGDRRQLGPGERTGDSGPAGQRQPARVSAAGGGGR